MLDARQLRDKFGPYSWASGNSEMLFRCPECKKPKKFYVNPRKGTGYCHVCHFTFADRSRFSPVRDGRVSELGAPDASPRSRSWVGLPEEATPLYGLALPPYAKEAKAARDYFESRGFGPADASAYKVSYCPSGTYAGRLIFPVSYQGTVYTFIARDYRNSGAPKVLHPPRSIYDKEDLAMMGLDQTVRSGSRTVVLVEGPFDVMAVGSPPGVALHGTHLSAARRAVLLRSFDRFILLLDNDEAGRSAKSELMSALSRAGKSVITPEIPEGDPGDLGKDKCAEIISPFL